MPEAVAAAQQVAGGAEVVEAELEEVQLPQPRLPWPRQLRQQRPQEVEVEAVVVVEEAVVAQLQARLQPLEAPQVDKPRLRNCPTT